MELKQKSIPEYFQEKKVIFVNALDLFQQILK
jgi:hypothetical protein